MTVTQNPRGTEENERGERGKERKREERREEGRREEKRERREWRWEKTGEIRNKRGE